MILASRLAGGVWEALLPGGGEPPRLKALLEGQEIGGLTVAPGEGGWLARLPVPPEAFSDGVRTLLLVDAATGAVLGSLALLAGDVLAHDLRAEIALLRAELDLLKRAFRRHCAEGEAGPGAVSPP